MSDNIALEKILTQINKEHFKSYLSRVLFIILKAFFFSCLLFLLSYYFFQNKYVDITISLLCFCVFIKKIFKIKRKVISIDTLKIYLEIFN